MEIYGFYVLTLLIFFVDAGRLFDAIEFGPVTIDEARLGDGQYKLNCNVARGTPRLLQWLSDSGEELDRSSEASLTLLVRPPTTTTYKCKATSYDGLVKEAERRVRVVSFDDVQCANREDGYYAHPKKGPCSARYVWCFDGERTEGLCRGQQRFDPDRRFCRNPGSIASCIEIAEVEKCSDLPDGVYPLVSGECSAEFVSCSHGRRQRVLCPWNTRFDALSGVCQYAKHVSACGGRSTPVSPAEKKPPFPIPVITLNCSALGDGLYEHPTVPCSRFYVSCGNGISRVMFCASENLRFDVISNKCLEIEYVEWCGGQATTEKSSTPRPQIDFDCSNKADGYYEDSGNRCSRTFYACTAGFADRLECPRGEVFDRPSTRCLFPNYVRSCGGAPTPLPPTTTRLPPLFDLGDANCTGKRNGNYPHPKKDCSNVFYACSHWTLYVKYCNPDYLRYDSVTDRCMERGYVEACGGRPTPIPPPPTTTESAAQAFDCSDKKTGLHSDPKNACSRVYYTCIGPAAYRLHCPAALYFDVESGDCVHKIHINACGGKSTRRPVETTTQKVRRTTVYVPDLDCSRRPSGYYEDPFNPCSSRYFKCEGGKTSEKRCRGTLKYDVIDRQCKLEHLVEWCQL